LSWLLPPPATATATTTVNATVTTTATATATGTGTATATANTTSTTPPATAAATTTTTATATPTTTADATATAKEFEGNVWVNGYCLGGEQLVAVDLLVFIRMLFFNNGIFWLCHKKIVRTQKRPNNPFKNETGEREKEWGEQNFIELAIAC
jgi:hypothetical protein